MKITELEEYVDRVGTALSMLCPGLLCGLGRVLPTPALYSHLCTEEAGPGGPS